MTRLLTAALALALPFAAGACKKEAPKDAAASGEILPGSISDAMLPEDRVISQPPLAPQAARGVKGAAKDAVAEATEAAAPDAPPSAEPAAEKAPE